MIQEQLPLLVIMVLLIGLTTLMVQFILARKISRRSYGTDRLKEKLESGSLLGRVIGEYMKALVKRFTGESYKEKQYSDYTKQKDSLTLEKLNSSSDKESCTEQTVSTITFQKTGSQTMWEQKYGLGKRKRNGKQ